MTHADTERLLSTYDCLSATTGHMLLAAQSADWDRLVELERRCTELVSRLSALETDEPLSETLRTRKGALIRKVLADDAAIRNITEPWLQQLESMLGANRHSQRLLRSYGPPGS